MTILKLPNAGDTHTMTITACQMVAGQYGEQVQFTSGPDTLYLPRASADRQLDRCGFFRDGEERDYDAVVGSTLTFSRDHNPKPGAKPFWGITVASPAEAKPKPVSKRLPPPATGDLPGDPASNWSPTDTPPAEDYRAREPGEEAPEPHRQADPKRDARHDSLKAFKALWRDVAAFQREVCQPNGQQLAQRRSNSQLTGMLGSNVEQEEYIPFDANSINQMAATIWIGWGNRGMQP